MAYELIHKLKVGKELVNYATIKKIEDDDRSSGWTITVPPLWALAHEDRSVELYYDKETGNLKLAPIVTENKGKTQFAYTVSKNFTIRVDNLPTRIGDPKLTQGIYAVEVVDGDLVINTHKKMANYTPAQRRKRRED